MKCVYPSLFNVERNIEVWFCDAPCCGAKKFHRDDGPAVTYPDGAVEWWHHGRRLTKEETSALRDEITTRVIDEGIQRTLPIAKPKRFRISDDGAEPKSAPIVEDRRDEQRAGRQSVPYNEKGEIVDDNVLTRTLEPDGPQIIARLDFTENPYPFFLSVSSLFTDLELAHDLGVLLTYADYEGYRFGQRFWMRNGRPLDPIHRLRTLTVVKQSPLGLELIIAAAGGLWVLVQIIDKVANWKLNRQKVELEVAKLRQEVGLKDMEILEKRLSLEQMLQKRKAEQMYKRLITRFNESELVLQDLRIRSTRE